MTKIRIISDIHNEWEEVELTPLETDNETILIVAGDINIKGRAAKSKSRQITGDITEVTPSWLDRMGDRFFYVLVVLGNHDHWGYSIELLVDKMKSRLTRDNVHILENDTFIINHTKFIGCTLWTDIDNANPISINAAKFSMVDFKKIRCKNHYRQISPLDLIEINENSKRFLNDELSKKWDGNIIVISHHAPSHQFVAEEFIGDSLNGNYYNNGLDDLIASTDNLKLWVHGHVHTSLDNMLGNCRILCNPRGYSPDYLNKDFDEVLTIDTDDFNIK